MELQIIFVSKEEVVEMARIIENPVVNERGEEEHPAFGSVRVSSVQSSPGKVMFDSDIRHSTYVSLEFSTATRKRDLKRDWIHSDKRLLQVSMSQAQWAALVSNFGGSPVPVTLDYVQGCAPISELPFGSRLEMSANETKDAAHEAFARVRKAFEVYQADKKVGNLRSLECAIQQAPGNIEFAAQSLIEHVETVTQKAKADIEAMVDARIQHLGLEQYITTKDILSLES